MRILLIAMSDSVHTARWIDQISDQGWDIHLFPSQDVGKIYPNLKNVTVHHSLYGQQQKDTSVKLRGVPVISYSGAFVVREVLKRAWPGYRRVQLRKLIKRLKPDIVHSLETQASGYLTLETKKTFENDFPPWIHTVWGSDLFLFARLKGHREKIKDVLTSCDYFLCECQRDVKLALSLGFTGEVLPQLPATGNFKLNKCRSMRQLGKVSERRIIMLKGYQSWSGRSLVGLRALERSADLLKGYEIAIPLATPEVEIAAALFSESTGIPVSTIPYQKPLPYEDILSYFGKARLFIGLSISDGLPSSLLEAMVMGAFPIQSWTSCANEWIEDFKNGILVPPEDPDIIELAIRRALTDDGLVNSAADWNYRLAEKKLDEPFLKPQAVEMYNYVLYGKKNEH